MNNRKGKKITYISSTAQRPITFKNFKSDKLSEAKTKLVGTSLLGAFLYPCHHTIHRMAHTVACECSHTGVSHIPSL